MIVMAVLLATSILLSVHVIVEGRRHRREELRRKRLDEKLEERIRGDDPLINAENHLIIHARRFVDDEERRRRRHLN